MANNNTLIVAGVLIAVIIVGALAATTLMNNNGNPVSATSAEATKLAIHNQGNAWVHMDIVMENVTLKNGTAQTLYHELWLQPVNGSVVMDLSNLLGYETTKLPAGTNIRLLTWMGHANSTPGGNADLNIYHQGWSNTEQPGSGDSKYELFYPGLSIDQLPAGVNQSTLWTATSINQLKQLEGNLTDTSQEQLYQELILTVDQNGKVTITPVTTPELCKLIAHIIPE